MEQSPRPNFADMLYNLVARLEIAVLAVIVLGLALRQIGKPISEQILVISMSALSTIFFLMAYRPP